MIDRLPPLDVPEPPEPYRCPAAGDDADALRRYRLADGADLDDAPALVVPPTRDDALRSGADYAADYAALLLVTEGLRRELDTLRRDYRVARDTIDLLCAAADLPPLTSEPPPAALFVSTHTHEVC